MNIKELAVMAHETALASGWWPANKMERSVPEMLLLLHRNVAKATDAYRNQNSVIEGYDWKAVFAEGLADVAIQILDMCEGFGLDIGDMRYAYKGIHVENSLTVDYLLELHRRISGMNQYIYYWSGGKSRIRGDGMEFTEAIATVIRVLFSLCEYQSIDLEAAIIAKNEINKTRQYRHGNKVC